MTKAEILDWLGKRVKPELLCHSIATQEMASKLADIYGVDKEKATLAGLIHDCAKQLPDEELVSLARQYDIQLDEIRIIQPGLLHAPVGAKLAQLELGITDYEVLHAIEIHNTGSRGMSALDKILYLADAAEPNRDYPGVERIRYLALGGDLDKAVLATMDMKILHVIECKRMLHPMSVEARNDVLDGIRTGSIRGNDRI